MRRSSLAPSSAAPLLKSLNRPLGRAVGGEPRDAGETEDRRDVDDRAARAHRAHDVLGAEEDAIDVDRHALAPALERHLRQRLDDADAGIVHQHVEAAEAVDDGRDRGLPIGFLGDVEGDEHRLRAALRQLGRERLASRRVDIGQRDRRAFRRERAGAGLADALRGTGDERDAALQSSCHPMLPRWSVADRGRAVHHRVDHGGLRHARLGVGLAAVG